MFMSFIFLGISSPSAKAVQNLESLQLNIQDAGREYRGTLFFPKKSDGPLPLVVVVHEWWGKTEYPVLRAKKISQELGYAALVVDLFGEGKTAETPDAAKALAGPFYENPEMGVARIEKFITAALDLSNGKTVSLDPQRIAAIGYCFGGTQVLNLARVGHLVNDHKLKGVVSFHGGLASSIKAKSPFIAKVLVLHGAADKMVKPEEVEAFQKEMKESQAILTLKAYPKALHAFTNPKATAIGKKYGIPVAYNATADKDSWKQMKLFLQEIFKE